jgi:class 3 adenylate cyclase
VADSVDAVAYPVHYAQVDGLNIAYQVVGDGPIDLVMVDEWATPLEARWDVPAIAGRLNRLTSFARVISFDKRGIGLSERGPDNDFATPEVWVRDLVAVVDAAEADKPVIFAAHEGGPIALMYAASLPDRTGGVILVNTGPRLTTGPDYPWGIPHDSWHPDIEGVRQLWSSGAGGEAHISATSHDPWWMEWYARSRRQQATPSAGLALLQMIGRVDVRHIAPAVRTPTLVLHREHNSWWPAEGARWLAENMPSATFKMLPGADNYWWSGQADLVIDEVEQFILGERNSPASERELVTIVFTDIADSAEHASRVGDAEWGVTLDTHDAITIAETERHGGAPLKNLGDGFFLRFDGPAAAIRAAREIRAALAREGLAIRVAIHTGEAERRGDDLNGVAVNLAARILDVADGGEILASGVVRGLVAGSDTYFQDRGRHAFRGIEGTWSVHEVTD